MIKIQLELTEKQINNNIIECKNKLINLLK